MFYIPHSLTNEDEVAPGRHKGPAPCPKPFGEKPEISKQQRKKKGTFFIAASGTAKAFVYSTCHLRSCVRQRAVLSKPAIRLHTLFDIAMAVLLN